MSEIEGTEPWGINGQGETLNLENRRCKLFSSRTTRKLLNMLLSKEMCSFSVATYSLLDGPDSVDWLLLGQHLTIEASKIMLSNEILGILKLKHGVKYHYTS
jgi:hypothetical protein